MLDDVVVVPCDNSIDVVHGVVFCCDTAAADADDSIYLLARPGAGAGANSGSASDSLSSSNDDRTTPYRARVSIKKFLNVLHCRVLPASYVLACTHNKYNTKTLKT